MCQERTRAGGEGTKSWNYRIFGLEGSFKVHFIPSLAMNRYLRLPRTPSKVSPFSSWEQKAKSFHGLCGCEEPEGRGWVTQLCPCHTEWWLPRHSSPVPPGGMAGHRFLPAQILPFPGVTSSLRTQNLSVRPCSCCLFFCSCASSSAASNPTLERMGQHLWKTGCTFLFPVTGREKSTQEVSPWT